jgi:hypothetical protein
MKQLLAVFSFIFISMFCVAQQDSITAVFAFPITDYMPEQNDSMTIVQVQLPDVPVVNINQNQLGVLKRRFEPGIPYDSSRIGWGRCQLVKGDYRYFGLHLDAGMKPKPGDLLYLRITIPLAYKGCLFDISRQHIHLQMVDDRYIYRKEDVYWFTSAADENKLLDSLLADIHYTGSVMLKQMADQNQMMDDGIYKGRKLFNAMQEATRTELITFLRFINARPLKYAGHSWKISEIFATWMVSGTPHVVEK